MSCSSSSPSTSHATSSGRKAAGSWQRPLKTGMPRLSQLNLADNMLTTSLSWGRYQGALIPLAEAIRGRRWACEPAANDQVDEQPSPRRSKKGARRKGNGSSAGGGGKKGRNKKSVRIRIDLSNNHFELESQEAVQMLAACEAKGLEPPRW